MLNFGKISSVKISFIMLIITFLVSTTDGGGAQNPVALAETVENSALRYFHNDQISSGDTTGTIDLEWTAPGDDDTVGTAHHYVIKYSAEFISDVTWDSNTQVPNPPLPLPAGSGQSHTITGLDCGRYYYVAIKTSDEAGNISLLSNIAENYASGIPTPSPIGAVYDSSGNLVTVYAGLVSSHLPLFYEFALDTNELFSNPLIGVDLIVDSLASTSFGNLEENIFYFWRVRAMASDHSDSSWWSEADSFLIYFQDNVVPVVTVISPNGGEQWLANSVHDITWTGSDQNGVTAHKLDYSSDAGQTWYVIADWSTGNPETFSWSIPEISSDQCLARAWCRDFAGNEGFDLSDSFFSISNIPLEITVVSPNGHERWNERSLQTVFWSDSGSQIDSFKIEYSINSGVDWIPVCGWTSGDPNEYEWLLPSTPSRQSRVKLSCRDNQGNEASDISDHNFSIRDATRPHVHVLFPDGGDHLEVGFDTLITWEASDNVGIDSFMIEYTTDNGISWDTVSDWMAGNPGLYLWSVPNTITGECLLRTSCKDADENAASDTSNSLFFIQDTVRPVVNILNPVPDDTLGTDTLFISWLAHDNGEITGFAAGYSTDNGTSWIEITHGNGGDSGYVAWRVPDGFPNLAIRVACIDEAMNIGEDTVYFYSTGIGDYTFPVPAVFELEQAYPNPFNPTTTIKYSLSRECHVLLEVFDILGSRVAVLVDQRQPAGRFQRVWDAGEASSGTYLYRIKAGEFTDVGKVLLLR